MNAENYLEHKGILGMHWGHRKAHTTSPVPVHETHNSQDHEQKIKLKGKKVNEMTNDELRSYVQRTSLEKQYKELTKSQMSPGKKYVHDLIINTAKGSLENILKKQVNKATEDLFNKMTKSKVP
jgi:CRISPR/Cas system CSM-associated protein Csm4 (group 5 of RAMP superfamily)